MAQKAWPSEYQKHKNHKCKGKGYVIIDKKLLQILNHYHKQTYALQILKLSKLHQDGNLQF